MGRDIRCYDDVRKNLQRTLNSLRFELSLWEAVRFPKKKNGECFSVMSKNFENANYKCNFQNLDYPTLEVGGFNHLNNGSYEKFLLYCYAHTDEMRSDDERKQKGIKPGCCMREIYIYTVPEVENAVVTRIANVNAQIKKYEKQLEVSEAVYTKFIDKVNEAIDEMKAECKELRTDGYTTSLEYLMIDALNSINYARL